MEDAEQGRKHKSPQNLACRPPAPCAQLQRRTPQGELCIHNRRLGERQQNHVTDVPSAPGVPSDLRNVNRMKAHVRNEKAELYLFPPQMGIHAEYLLSLYRRLLCPLRCHVLGMSLVWWEAVTFAVVFFNIRLGFSFCFFISHILWSLDLVVLFQECVFSKA